MAETMNVTFIVMLVLGILIIIPIYMKLLRVIRGCMQKRIDDNSRADEQPLYKDLCKCQNHVDHLKPCQFVWSDKWGHLRLVCVCADCGNAF